MMTLEKEETLQKVSYYSAKLALWLQRPLSLMWCMVGWFTATALFVGVTSLSHFQEGGDAYASVYITWSVAHLHLACGYPFGGVNDNLAPPLYPLVAGGISALFRIGHSVPFPDVAQLGNHCKTAGPAMDHWAQQSGAWWGTLRTGFVGWLVLVVGVVALLRASGRGRCYWEPITLCFVALTPPVSMCLIEYFHPQDLLALGLALWGISRIVRKRVLSAGLLLGLAMLSQQYTLLVFLPVFVAIPKNLRLKFLSSTFASVLCISTPFLLFTSGRAIETILTGTGASTHGLTLLNETGLHSSLLILVARFFPLASALIISVWAERRLGSDLLQPVPLMSLVATCLCMRLVFEINMWGYYFMAVAVALILLDVMNGRIRASLVVWMIAVTLVAQHVIVHSPSVAAELYWQAILVSAAITLAIRPLWSFHAQQLPSRSQSATGVMESNGLESPME